MRARIHKLLHLLEARQDEPVERTADLIIYETTAQCRNSCFIYKRKEEGR